MMIRDITFKIFVAGFFLFSGLPAAFAADQARAIVNALDPKSMNELFEVSRRQPDAALTSITPVSANTFRFLFIWPASNPIMTYDRVGRSFVERFVGFADQLKLLAVGFCLPSRNIFFGTASYGEEDVNVAYRDIEVRYNFGWQAPCAGRYIPIAEIEQRLSPTAAFGGYDASLPRNSAPSPKEPSNPQEQLKPFLNPQPTAPLE